MMPVMNNKSFLENPDPRDNSREIEAEAQRLLREQLAYEFWLKSNVERSAQ
jgi:hypothetical protein